MKRSLMILHLLFIAVLFSSGSAASAAPSYVGYTGLLFTPNAETVGEGDVQASAQNIDLSLEDFTGFSLTLGLNDAEALVRGACAWALGQSAAARAAAELRKRLAVEKDPAVGEEIRQALRSC